MGYESKFRDMGEAQTKAEALRTELATQLQAELEALKKEEPNGLEGNFLDDFLFDASEAAMTEEARAIDFSSDLLGRTGTVGAEITHPCDTTDKMSVLFALLHRHFLRGQEIMPITYYGLLRSWMPNRRVEYFSAKCELDTQERDNANE